MDLTWLENLPPAAAESLLTSLDIDSSRDACEASLAEFCRQSWHILEPGRRLIWNWHLDVICAYLEALAYGEILRLIINVPPGTMKSLLSSVQWPAWLWCQRPDLRFICGTNDQALATRDALAMRTLIGDDWYQARWGTRAIDGRREPWVEINPSQDEKTLYQTTRRGHRQSLAMMAKVTGKRGDVQIIDDPHDTAQVESDVKRARVIDKWDAAWSTRVNDLAFSPRLLIMQRQHVNDLTGHLENSSDDERWVKLVIPMRYEGEPTYDAGKDIGRPDLNDPRTEEGELMFPARFPERAVRALEARLGSYGTAGQLQQRPHPKGGGDFLAEWIQRYSRRPSGGNRYILVDPAGEKRGRRAKRDFTAMGVIELGSDHNYYVLDLIRDRMGLAERTRTLFQLHQKYSNHGRIMVRVGYEAFGKDSDGVHIREKQEELNYRFPIIELGRGDSTPKEDRIRALAPLFEEGRFYFPVSLHRTLYDGSTVDIVEQFIEQEYKAFPVAKFDDCFDMLSRILDPKLEAVFPQASLAGDLVMDPFEPIDPGAGY